VAWSSDGRLVAVSDQSWTISLFEAATSALVATLKGHHDAPRSLGFSRDGRMLVSAGSADMTVRLWEVPSGRLLQVMDLRDETRTAALLPDGRSLVAGYGELLVLAPVSLELWKKDPAAMLEEAQRDASMKLDGFTLLPR
jgi:WD40 repeat protein